MRISILLLLMTLSLIMLFVTACNFTDDEDGISTPTSIYGFSPTVAEWVISFSGLGAKSPYLITAFWIGGFNPPGFSDEAILYVNGNEVDLLCLLPGFWIGEVNAAQGQTSAIKFVYNGVTKTDTNLKMVNLITDSDFPDNYNPANSAAFSWTLPLNNEHQVAGVTATKELSEDEEWSEDYSKEIPVSARYFTVPANPINNVPPGAEYTLWVSQVNFKVNSRTALMSICTSQSGSLKQDLSHPSRKNLALNIFRTLTK